MIILEKYTHTPYGVSKEKPQGVTRFRTIKKSNNEQNAAWYRKHHSTRIFQKRMRIFFEIRFGGTERWSEEMPQNYFPVR